MDYIIKTSATDFPITLKVNLKIKKHQNNILTNLIETFSEQPLFDGFHYSDLINNSIFVKTFK